jgi:hypothetical protein
MSSDTGDRDKLQVSLVVRIVGAILVSILIPVFVGFAHNSKGGPLFTNIEQFAIGCFVFVAITLTGVSYDLAALLRLRQSDYEVWRIRMQADEWLQNIRSSFVSLLQEGGPQQFNLFAQYFLRIFAAVADDINGAAAKNELRVDELTFGATDLLMRIMEARGDQILCLVHTLDARPNNFDFTSWSRSYYSELTSLAKSKKIAEIRRLFIYSSEDDLKDGFAQCLFAFHATNAGYDFRALPRTDWTNLVRGLGLHDVGSELGIWGEFLAYTALRSSSVGMQGVYTCLPRQIDRFRELFDAAWRLAERPAMRTDIQQVSVAELFRWETSPDVAGQPPAPLAGLGLTGDGISPTSGDGAAVPTQTDARQQ